MKAEITILVDVNNEEFSLLMNIARAQTPVLCEWKMKVLEMETLFQKSGYVTSISSLEKETEVIIGKGKKNG